MDRKYLQPVVEVMTKRVLFYHGEQVTMRRRYEAHVYLVSPVATEPLEFLLLQDTEQFRLEFQGNVADFVQEECSLVCSSKRPVFCATAPVNAPFS